MVNHPKDEPTMMPPVTPTSESLFASLLTLVDFWEIKTILCLGLSYTAKSHEFLGRSLINI